MRLFLVFYNLSYLQKVLFFSPFSAYKLILVFFIIISYFIFFIFLLSIVVSHTLFNFLFLRRASSRKLKERKYSHSHAPGRSTQVPVGLRRQGSVMCARSSTHAYTHRVRSPIIYESKHLFAVRFRWTFLLAAAVPPFLTQQGASRLPECRSDRFARRLRFIVKEFHSPTARRSRSRV